jgi:hypothetical protein
LTCDFGSLPKGGSAVATIRVQAAATGVALETASVVSDQMDANPADNNSSATVHVKSGSSTPAHLTTPLALPGGQFQFTLSGAAGASYRIEVSPDLKTWAPWRTVVLTGAATNITDSAGVSNRFYRAVQ